MSLNPVQIFSHGAEEERSETARMVCVYDIVDIDIDIYIYIYPVHMVCL